MAALTKAGPEEMEPETGRGGADPCSAPGGPASPVPGVGVSKLSRPRLSSASLVYGLAAARPVAGREGRNVPCAVGGPRDCWPRAPPHPSRPTRVGKLRPVLASLRVLRVPRSGRAQSAASVVLPLPGRRYLRASLLQLKGPVTPSVQKPKTWLVVCEGCRVRKGLPRTSAPRPLPQQEGSR